MKNEFNVIPVFYDTEEIGVFICSGNSVAFGSVVSAHGCNLKLTALSYLGLRQM